MPKPSPSPSPTPSSPVWNPAKLLQIHNPETEAWSCMGETQVGRRCRRLLSQSKRDAILLLLLKISPLPPRDTALDDEYLESLSRCCFCYDHDDDEAAEKIMNRWEADLAKARSLAAGAGGTPRRSSSTTSSARNSPAPQSPPLPGSSRLVSVRKRMGTENHNGSQSSPSSPQFQSPMPNEQLPDATSDETQSPESSLSSTPSTPTQSPAIRAPQGPGQHDQGFDQDTSTTTSTVTPDRNTPPITTTTTQPKATTEPEQPEPESGYEAEVESNTEPEPEDDDDGEQQQGPRQSRRRVPPLLPLPLPLRPVAVQNHFTDESDSSSSSSSSSSLSTGKPSRDDEFDQDQDQEEEQPKKLLERRLQGLYIASSNSGTASDLDTEGPLTN